MTDKIVELVLSKFPVGFPFSLVSSNRGLSESVVYKVSSSNGVFALKSYNQSSLSSLQNAHALLDQTRVKKFVLFPLIIRNKENATDPELFAWHRSPSLREVHRELAKRGLQE